MKDNEILLGSDVQPALVDVGAAEPVQLGTIVAAAHEASGLSVDDWNYQSDDDREGHIAGEIVRRHAENEKPADDEHQPEVVDNDRPATAEVATDVGSSATGGEPEDGLKPEEPVVFTEEQSFTEKTAGKAPIELTNEERQGLLAETSQPPHLEGDHGPAGEARARAAFLRDNPPRRVD